MGTLTDPMTGARRTEIGGVIVDEVAAGDGRVKRVIYPAGWRWVDAMAPVTGTASCQHVHVGCLVQGSMTVRFDDGCDITYVAPAPVVLEAGHTGWVNGDEPAVLIQVDTGADTVDRLGLASVRHVCPD